MIFFSQLKKQKQKILLIACSLKRNLNFKKHLKKFQQIQNLQLQRNHLLNIQPKKTIEKNVSKPAPKKVHAFHPKLPDELKRKIYQEVNDLTALGKKKVKSMEIIADKYGRTYASVKMICQTQKVKEKKEAQEKANKN